MRALLAAWALAAATLAFGQASEIDKPDAQVEQRLKGLAEELRCLVCQNQTIADSNAPLALDLRNQIRAQIAQGRSDTQIRDYMVERYGDFVLYRPPLKASTLILWLGPFVLLAAAALAAARIIRARKTGAPPETAPKRRAEIEALLEASGDEPRQGAGAQPAARVSRDSR
jgi:cytochrome c-type biogenesis protein CcmH